MKKGVFGATVLFIFTFCNISAPSAAPNLTTVMGAIESGSSVVITGSSFGTGPTVYKWDDFEGATHIAGQTIGDGPAGQTAWTRISADDSKTEPKISKGSSRTNSTKFVRCEWDHSSGNKYDCRFYYEHGSTLSPVYMTWYTRWDHRGTYVTNNEKFWRICHTTDRNAPYFRWVRNCAHPNANCNSEWHVDGGDGIPWPNNYQSSPDEEEWIRTEFYGVESDAGVSNGTIIVCQQQSDNDAIHELICETTHKTRSGSNHWDTVVFGDYLNNTSPVIQYYHDYDDIYIANSRARVEIGDNATWADCTLREIQIPTAWSNSSITINANQGSFSDGEDVYLFVVDADGNASNGHGPITIGGGSGDNPPSVAISSPTTESMHSTSESTINIAGTAADYHGIDSVIWNINEGQSQQATNESGDWTSWSIINISLEDGENVIAVTATDSASQTSTDTITVTYSSEPVDNPPNVNITTPTSASTYATAESTVEIGGTASDDVGISTVTWTNNLGGSGTANNDSGDWTSWSITNTSLEEGENVITVTATDSATQTSTDTITLTYSASGVVQAWSATEQTGDSSWTDSTSIYCLRILSGGDKVSRSGNSVMLGFQGRTSGDYGIKKVSIAQRDVNGQEGDVIDSTWTSVTFDGNSVSTWNSDVATVSAGAEKLSDPIPFSIQPGKDYYVTFLLENHSVYLSAPDGYKEFYFGDGSDHTDDVDWSQNGHQTYQFLHALSKIYVVGDNGDTTAPGDVSNFTAEAGDSQVALSWTNPTDDDFAGTMVRYRTDGTHPTDHNNGTLVCDRTGAPGSDDSFTHTQDVQAGVTYYYSAFTYDEVPNYSETAHASATPTASVPSDMVAHWEMNEGSDEIATDSSGNGNDGTLSGPTWTIGIGKIGGALHFDGTDDYVDVGTFDVIAGSAGNDGLTLAAWFKADSFISTSADNRIISKSTGTSTQNHYWMLSTINSDGVKLRFRLKTDGTTTTLIASSGNIAVGEWVHAVATYDGSNMRLYQNGVEVGSTAKTGTISTNNAVSVNIGRNPDGSKEWSGIIDDVRIYNRALSQGEIQALIESIPDDPDTTAPTVTITQPTVEDTYHTEEDSVTLAGSASDNISVISVTWANNRGGSGSASGTSNWTIPGMPLHCGDDNIVTITATDAAGNTATDTLTIDVKPCPVSGIH